MPNGEDPMTLEKSDLEELKAIYLKRYNVRLDNDQAYELGMRLISLFLPIVKPIPHIDTFKKKTKNGVRNG